MKKYLMKKPTYVSPEVSLVIFERPMCLETSNQGINDMNPVIITDPEGDF